MSNYTTGGIRSVARLGESAGLQTHRLVKTPAGANAVADATRAAKATRVLLILDERLRGAVLI